MATTRTVSEISRIFRVFSSSILPASMTMEVKFGEHQARSFSIPFWRWGIGPTHSVRRGENMDP